MNFGDRKVDKVIYALSQDKIDDAIGILVPIVRNDKEMLHQVIQLSARNKRVEKRVTKGFISRSDADIERNAIIKRLLVNLESLSDDN